MKTYFLIVPMLISTVLFALHGVEVVPKNTRPNEGARGTSGKSLRCAPQGLHKEGDTWVLLRWEKTDSGIMFALSTEKPYPTFENKVVKEMGSCKLKQFVSVEKMKLGETYEVIQCARKEINYIFADTFNHTGEHVWTLYSFGSDPKKRNSVSIGHCALSGPLNELRE